MLFPKDDCQYDALSNIGFAKGTALSLRFSQDSDEQQVTLCR